MPLETHFFGYAGEAAAQLALGTSRWDNSGYAWSCEDLTGGRDTTARRWHKGRQTSWCLPRSVSRQSAQSG